VRKFGRELSIRVFCDTVGPQLSRLKVSRLGEIRSNWRSDRFWKCYRRSSDPAIPFEAVLHEQKVSQDAL